VKGLTAVREKGLECSRPSAQIGGGGRVTLLSPVKDEAVLFLWKPMPPR
jgi:hypothetical protein